MAYTTTADFKILLDEHETEAIRRDYEKDGVDKLKLGMAYAETYVSDRLGQRYDMATEYVKTGADRNLILIDLICKVAIWQLCQVFPTVRLDGKRDVAYQSAMADLKEAQKGNLLHDLPTIETPSTTGLPQYGADDNAIIY